MGIAAGFAIEQPAAIRTFHNTIMKQIFTTGLIFAAFIYASLAADLNTARIDELTGLKGKMNEKEGVYKVTFPRNDVKVVVDGWTMPPFMGLGTWAAFTKGEQTEAMVMGDTVLFEDEVNAAMSAALDNGLSVTALHNHFFFDQPKVFFMHIEGEGTIDKQSEVPMQNQQNRFRSLGNHRCRKKIPSPLHLSTRSSACRANPRTEWSNSRSVARRRCTV